jgi:chromosome segregation protein
LFFWAGPRSKADQRFLSAKGDIESDRHFARKFVLEEDDLKRRLGERDDDEEEAKNRNIEVADTWSEMLHAESLAVLLEQGPRTKALELIESGDAFKVEAVRSTAELKVVKDVLASGFLRKLSVGQFRRVHTNRSFDFGDVNLIVGPNGAGKTSLLEAIEALYCGYVRRESKASYEKVVGSIESADGKIVELAATTDTGTLKSRNMAWYGRVDSKAVAISQGFTRFNFLDTDAAFRLASEKDPEQIQLELAQLLVGPETSRLWAFLSKLREDVEANAKSVSDQRPVTLLTIDLLTEKIAELRNAPSQANSLVKAFRSSVHLLRPKWVVPDVDSALSDDERTALSKLLNEVERAIASSNETPVTGASLNKNLAATEALEASVTDLHRDYEAALSDAHVASVVLGNRLRNKDLIEQWHRLLGAGVPSLSARLDGAESEAAGLLKILQSHQTASPYFVPPEYESIPVSLGLSLAKNAYDAAQENEHAAVLAQTQAQQLGQTLDTLRRDLYDAAKSYVERSGERTLCPVCKTEHADIELHAKLQALIPSGVGSVPEGLLHAQKLAAERTEDARRTLNALMSLDGYRALCDAAADSSPGQLQSDLKIRRERFQAVSRELDVVRNEVGALKLVGIDVQGWETIRKNAIPAMPVDIDIDNLGQVEALLQGMKGLVSSDEALKAEADSGIEKLVVDAKLFASEIGMPSTADFDIDHLCAFVERMVKRAAAGVQAIQEIYRALPVDGATSIDMLQTQLHACILSFDVAAQAAQQETGSSSELKLKESELQAATAKLAKNETAGQNLSRALTCLTNIVEKHSLDKATSETFAAIRGTVSDIFAQIHSPAEYTLGNFSDGQLIIRCDDAKPHDVNQVSTGQRAALALSIFLALNQNASTAPPVILIDDPVAHIDDLNALSFLDYLRDVSVTQRRQVFFATADARLAALFQRKFEFLGDRFKRINLR